MFLLPGQLRTAKGQLKPGRDLFGLVKIRLRTGRQRVLIQRRDPLIGLGALALINQNREIALADLRKGRLVGVQAGVIKAGIGANAGRGAVMLGRVIIGGNDPGRAVAAHLNRQLPVQLDRLADQRGQQGNFGDQRFDLIGIVVLGQNGLQHPIQTGDAAPCIGEVQLKGQYGIIPCGVGALRHVFGPSGVDLAIARLQGQGNRG